MTKWSMKRCIEKWLTQIHDSIGLDGKLEGWYNVCSIEPFSINLYNIHKCFQMQYFDMLACKLVRMFQFS